MPRVLLWNNPTIREIRPRVCRHTHREGWGGGKGRRERVPEGGEGRRRERDGRGGEKKPRRRRRRRRAGKPEANNSGEEHRCFQTERHARGGSSPLLKFRRKFQRAFLTAVNSLFFFFQKRHSPLSSSPLPSSSLSSPPSHHTRTVHARLMVPLSSLLHPCRLSRSCQALSILSVSHSPPILLLLTLFLTLFLLSFSSPSPLLLLSPLFLSPPLSPSLSSSSN